MANASSEEATLRLRAEVPWRAKCQPFFVSGGRKAGRYEIPVDGRNRAHQLRGSFKGGNFKPCLFHLGENDPNLTSIFQMKPPASSLSSFFVHLGSVGVS